MKNKLLKLSLLTGAGVLLADLPASAAVLITNSIQQTAYTVSATDLLQASGTTHVNANSGGAIADNNAAFTFSDGTDTGASVGVPSLYNGSFGTMPPASGAKNRADFAGITGQGTGVAATLTTTYSFDLGASPLGYDIAQIDIYTAWNSSTRDDIRLNIFYATVADPTTFILLTSVTNNTAAGTSPVANRSSVTENATGVLATGVSSLRFSFPTQENNGVGYREIDVILVPEPASAMMLLGGLGMFFGLYRSRASRV